MTKSCLDWLHSLKQISMSSDMYVTECSLIIYHEFESSIFVHMYSTDSYLDVDGTYPKSVWYIFRSFHGEKDQKYFLSPCLFLISTKTDGVQDLWKPPGCIQPHQQWSRSAARVPGILLNLVRTHFLARFVYFRFLSSVYIPARF